MHLMICYVQEFPYQANNLEVLNHTTVIKTSRLDSTTNTPSNKVPSFLHSQFTSHRDCCAANSKLFLLRDCGSGKVSCA